MEDEGIAKKIHHHTRKAVHRVRAKPYETRMHIVRWGTVLVGLCVVVLWVSLLKRQLKIEPVVKKREIEKQQIISEGILRVYDKAKQAQVQTQSE